MTAAEFFISLRHYFPVLTLIHVWSTLGAIIVQQHHTGSMNSYPVFTVVKQKHFRTVCWHSPYTDTFSNPLKLIYTIIRSTSTHLATTTGRLYNSVFSTFLSDKMYSIITSRYKLAHKTQQNKNKLGLTSPSRPADHQTCIDFTVISLCQHDLVILSVSYDPVCQISLCVES